MPNDADVPLPVSSSASVDAASATPESGRQAFADEPLKHRKGCSLVTRRISVRQQLAQRQRIGERQSTHLARCHLGVLHVSSMDCPLEASACCALDDHRFDAAGPTAQRAWPGEAVARPSAGVGVHHRDLAG